MQLGYLVFQVKDLAAWERFRRLMIRPAAVAGGLPA